MLLSSYYQAIRQDKCWVNIHGISSPEITICLLCSLPLLILITRDCLGKIGSFYPIEFIPERKNVATLIWPMTDLIIWSMCSVYILWLHQIWITFWFWFLILILQPDHHKQAIAWPWVEHQSVIIQSSIWTQWWCLLNLLSVICSLPSPLELVRVKVISDWRQANSFSQHRDKD